MDDYAVGYVDNVIHSQQQENFDKKE